MKQKDSYSSIMRTFTSIGLVALFLFGISNGMQCLTQSKLVYHEKGDVVVTALLDFTQGPQCNQTNPASLQSSTGILQTIRTLNSIQYLKGLKIGVRVYDTCSQESRALQAVLETTLEANLVQLVSCRADVHLGFLFPLQSYPAAVQLLNVLNLPVADISYWQTTSPLDAVADLLTRFKWTSVAIISQSKETLLNFSKVASHRNICIVAQSFLSPVSRTKEVIARAVRRSRRSGSKVYILMGSSEFLMTVLPSFQSAGSNTTSSTANKFVLLASDSWSSNFTQEVGLMLSEALVIRPQRVLTDDNVSARVLYSLVKQFKTHLLSTCNGKLNLCEFEPNNVRVTNKVVLDGEDLRILKLATDISIYNELFPVSYLSSNGSVVDIGNIHEDKFIPFENLTIGKDNQNVADCPDCLCTNVEAGPQLILQLRSELHIIVLGSVSLLGVLLVITGLIFMIHVQCCSSHDSRSANFIFWLLFAILVLLLASFTYILVPSSTLCLARVIGLSGAYTFFFSSVFSIVVTSLIGDKSIRLFIQVILFALAISVQVPVLTYETLFRDETLLINKFLTDYGPKVECTLDDMLLLKLFVFPAALIVFITIGSCILISNHWQVSAVKIKLGISSLVCLLVNIAWIVCYFQLDPDWRDVVTLAGIQGNVFTMLLGVVLPKIIEGNSSLRNSFATTSSWQNDLLNNRASSGSEEHASHPPSSLAPDPPARPQPPAIYSIPQYNHQVSDSESTPM